MPALDSHCAHFGWPVSNQTHSFDEQMPNCISDWFASASHLFPNAGVVSRMLDNNCYLT